MATFTNADKESKDDRVASLFAEFDRDGNGTIDHEEFQDLAFACGETLSPEEVDAVVANLDADGNGTIDISEFRQWLDGQDGNDDGMDVVARAKKNLLKAKLAARYLVRKLRNATEDSKEADGEAKSSVASVVTNNYNVNISLGSQNDVESRVQVELSTPPKILLDNMPGKAAISVVIECQPGTSDFEIGDMAGRIQAIKSIVGGIIPLDMFGTFKVTPTDFDNGSKGLRLTFDSEKNLIVEDAPPGAIPFSPSEILDHIKINAGVSYGPEAIIHGDQSASVADLAKAIILSIQVALKPAGWQKILPVLKATAPPYRHQKMEQGVLVFEKLQGISFDVNAPEAVDVWRKVVANTPASDMTIADVHRSLIEGMTNIRDAMKNVAPNFGISDADAEGMYNALRRIKGVREFTAITSVGLMLSITGEGNSEFEMLPEW